MKLRIGSRESQLAVIQSRLVMAQIQAACPDIELELVTMKTTGDRILNKTLDKIGGKGLFVKELDQALLDGRVDLTVHSLKDLPMETNPALPAVAYSKREDPRDVLVLPKGCSFLDPTRPIGCSSRRRSVQLRALYPETEVRPVRGNVQTRLARLDEGAFSGLVLAAAGLRRLGLTERITRCFSTEEMIPAAGQGILAVQFRGDVDPSLLRLVNDEVSTACALAERAFVRALNGDCSSPVAAYATIKENSLTLSGLYVSEDETVLRRGCLTGPLSDGAEIGAVLACRLKEGMQ